MTARLAQALPGARSSWWRVRVVIPTLTFCVLLAIDRLGGLDWRLANAFFDPVSASFPARHDHLFKYILHQGGDRLIMAVALCALLLACASGVVRAWRDLRRPALYVLLSMAATTGLVAVAKHTTGIDCPWALTRYGGTRHYLAPFAPRPPGIPRGECFPAAHSAGAFALASLAFLCGNTRHMRAGLLAVTALGLSYAAVQWARGAHFVSHDIWSAWIAWLVCASAHRMMYAERYRVERVLIERRVIEAFAVEARSPYERLQA